MNFKLIGRSYTKIHEMSLIHVRKVPNMSSRIMCNKLTWIESSIHRDSSMSEIQELIESVIWYTW